MDHIEIRPGKLKLMLTRDEVNRYQLDGENASSKEGLKRLLEETEQYDLPEHPGGQTLVQYYPSSDGSAEIYITRMILPSFFPQKELTERNQRSFQGMTVYSFDSLDHLLDACAKVGPTLGKKLFSTAFAVGHTYYLLTAEPSSGQEHFLSEIKAFLSEYGHSAEHQLTVAYLNEHGECLVPDCAIEVLSLLA